MVLWKDILDRQWHMTGIAQWYGLPVVIFGLMISGSFFMSAIAASGRPQFATVGMEGGRGLTNGSMIWTAAANLVPKSAECEYTS